MARFIDFTRGLFPGNCNKKGSIVGVGAVVTKDVESYSVVGRVAAKLIKKRN